MSACGASAPPPFRSANSSATPKPAASADAADQVAIYEAVVRRVCQADDTAGGQLRKPNVYIVGRTDDTAGDPTLPASETATIPPSVRERITARLADLPSKIVWVESDEDVARNSRTGMVADSGVIVKVGNIRALDDDTVRVAASLYFANLGAGGRTYMLKRVDGTWTIIGTTGTEWIS